MNGRLFAWLFESQMKKMIPWALVSLISAAIFCGLSLLPSSNMILAMLNGIALVAAIAIPALTVFMNSVYLWLQTRRIFFQDEAYLIQTLPMKRITIVITDLLVAALSSLIVIAFVGLCFYIELKVGAPDVISDLQATGMPLNWSILAPFLSAIVLQELFITFCGILAVFLGYRCKGSKLSKSILIGILLYYGCQIVMVGLCFGFVFLQPDWRILFDESALVPIEMMISLLWMIAGLYALFLVLLISLTVIFGQKPVDVE